MVSLTCSWRSAALPAGCEIYEFAGPKIKRQLEAAATFNSNNTTKRGARNGGGEGVWTAPFPLLPQLHLKVSSVPSAVSSWHCQVGGLLLLVALLWPRIGNGRKRKIPKRTQSGLSILKILLNTENP